MYMTLSNIMSNLQKFANNFQQKVVLNFCCPLQVEIFVQWSWLLFQMFFNISTGSCILFSMTEDEGSLVSKPLLRCLLWGLGLFTTIESLKRKLRGSRFSISYSFLTSESCFLDNCTEIFSSQWRPIGATLL